MKTLLITLSFLTAGMITSTAEEPSQKHTFKDASEKYTFTIDTTTASDLTEWVKSELTPVVKAWYPKIVEMLPSEGFQAPQEVVITFKDDLGGIPAYAAGNRISCNSGWYRKELKREAKGCTVHELVHVAQQYGRKLQPEAMKFPGWMTEGLADYIRWFLYEPESKGAELSARQADRVNYDGNYRITANFLNWVVGKHSPKIVAELNAAAREGRYHDSMWIKLTGKTVAELGAEWKAALKGTAAVVNAGQSNQLSDAERADGWKLLFDGKSLDGWNNFKATTIKPGWQVQDGTLACIDPKNAGDLCTKESFDWFELQLEYNISEAGNSGIIYHVSPEGGAVWASGPEFQLEDNQKAKDPVRCGWLYGLYQPPVDAATGKTLDATKPVGEWNQVRLVISPEKCEHFINGVKYFEYQLGSEDFRKRVAASKFNQMPLFAKERKGFLALQGDHGQVRFRNIKLKPLSAVK
jgi:hypothetical protein